MNVSFGPGQRGTRLLLGIAGMLILSSVTAQQPAGSSNIDPNVVNLFLESRIQKPANQATPEERTGVMNELADIYLVTDQSEVQEMAKQPRTKAQLELQKRAILFNAFAVDFIEKNPATEQEVADLYQEQIAASPPKEYKARHILVESQAQALSLVKELDDGADFVELAKEKSTGPSGPNGGDLGWFETRSMVKEFSDAVVALEDNAYTATPVQTQFGWHVIFREGSRDGTAPTLESVQDVIQQRIAQDKFQAYIEQLRPDSVN